MGFAFAKVAFEKLKMGEILSSNGEILLRELSIRIATSPESGAVQIDLSALGLSTGTYYIAATAVTNSSKYLESEKSNTVIYTVN